MMDVRLTSGQNCRISNGHWISIHLPIFTRWLLRNLTEFSINMNHYQFWLIQNKKKSKKISDNSRFDRRQVIKITIHFCLALPVYYAMTLNWWEMTCIAHEVKDNMHYQKTRFCHVSDNSSCAFYRAQGEVVVRRVFFSTRWSYN
jgi:hypothetical protein